MISGSPGPPASLKIRPVDPPCKIYWFPRLIQISTIPKPGTTILHRSYVDSHSPRDTQHLNILHKYLLCGIWKRRLLCIAPDPRASRFAVRRDLVAAVGGFDPACPEFIHDWNFWLSTIRFRPRVSGAAALSFVCAHASVCLDASAKSCSNLA